MEANIGERIEQRRVKLADLICCGGRPFVRRRGESLADMRARLLAMDGLLARGKRKALAYERAGARGQVFPPVFVIALEGEFLLDDGCHRCAAAAMQGEQSISAVVVNAASRGDADTVSALLFDLEEAGVVWQERARFAEVVVKAA